MQGKTYAKVNLILEITGKRPDGYHEIDTVMTEVDLFDELSLEIAEKGISVSCDAADIPSDETNLAYRAADYMLKKYGIEKGVRIAIRKNIPSGAGLGGGSSDAAWVVKAVNEAFALGLSDARMEEDAANLGADVAFFIKGGTQRARGIGEKLTPVKKAAPLDLVIIKPEFPVSTALAYKELKADERGSSEACEQFAGALEAGKVSEISALLDNTLEYSSLRLRPEIADIKEELKAHGAVNSLMSGSGSAVFGVFKDEAAAQKGYEELKKAHPDRKIFLSHM